MLVFDLFHSFLHTLGGELGIVFQQFMRDVPLFHRH
jgi:hypothetical protein